MGTVSILLKIKPNSYYKFLMDNKVSAYSINLYM